MCLRSDKDDASRQLDPPQIPSRTAIQTPSDATELGQKGMPPLDGAADAADARLSGSTPLGSLHPKARCVGPPLGRAVPVSAIGTGTRQIPWIGGGDRDWGGRRLHHHRLQNRLRLHTVVGSRLGDHGPQGQAMLVGR